MGKGFCFCFFIAMYRVLHVNQGGITSHSNTVVGTVSTNHANGLLIPRACSCLLLTWINYQMREKNNIWRQISTRSLELIA